MPIGGSNDAQLPPDVVMNSDGTYTNTRTGRHFTAGADGQWHGIGSDGQQIGPYDPEKDGAKPDYWSGGNVPIGQDGMVQAYQMENSELSNSFNWMNEKGAAEKDASWNEGWANLVKNRNAPTADLRNDAQSRGLMMAGAQGYQGMLAGNGPSMANSAQNRAMTGAQGNAMMQQAGASRGNMAAAGRGAMLGLGQGGQQAAMAGAGQRLAETNQAVSGLAGASSDMYAGDVNSAKQRNSLELDNRAGNDAAAANFTKNAIAIRGTEMENQHKRNLAAAQALQGWNNEHQAKYAKRDADDNRFRDTVIKGTGAVIGAMASDENLKTDIEDGDSDVRSAMDALKPYNYRYKDEGLLGAGKRVGIMAQDLEKSEMGKATVTETKIGKVVDLPKAMGLVLASVANLNKRLAKVEK